MELREVEGERFDVGHKRNAAAG